MTQSYFLENENFEIIYYLKKYLGFGELLNKVDLIVDENLDRVHNYVKNKISEKKVQLLYKDNISKNKYKKYNLDESDEDEKRGKTDKEEEEEEEEEEEKELSEETKNIIKSQTHCY